jgi:hypothetical protein
MNPRSKIYRYIIHIVANRTVLLFFILLSKCCQNCRFGHGPEFYSHRGGVSCAARVESSYAPRLLRKHTVAAYNFNWMTVYVSKHSRIVSNRVLRTVLCLAYLRARDLAIATLIYIGFNINYEKAAVVWQQFGFGS